MENVNMTNYENKHLEFIHNLREKGIKWPEVAVRFNTRFDTNKAHDALRLVYARHKELLDAGIPEVDVALLRQARNASKTSSKNRRALNITLDAIEQQEDLIRRIETLVKNSAIEPIKTAKTKHRVAGTPMIMEVLLSDLHYGKKTDTFNYVRARELMREYASVVEDQFRLQTKQAKYAVKSIDLAFLGDIIESSTMHGAESLKSCEFGNSEQVVAAIESLFADMVVPVASLGVPVNALCVTGNHGRTQPQKTFIKPGKEHLSWIIYKTLEMLCQKSKLPVTFKIAEGPTLVHRIFNDLVLYEHYDLVGACTKKALSDMLAKRQTQVGEIINFYRGGHYHEYTIFDRGRIIVNGCLPGNDGYSESFGYSTESVQAINFYCKNDSRPNSYYYTFPVYLGAKK